MKRIAAPFVWSTYVDATLAGISILLPLPFLDSSSEAYFRRRMVETIARQHNQSLSPSVIEQLASGNEGTQSFFRRLYLWPMKVLLTTIKRFSRKIVYVLTIQQAINALADYWRRAYLLDQLMSQHDLSSEETRQHALLALQQTLQKSDRSPLLHLARQITLSPLSLWRAIRNARNGKEDKRLRQIHAIMEEMWGNFASYFTELDDRLAANYAKIKQ